MGDLVLAAKVSHVPSLMLSEVPGSPLAGARKGAVDALRELGRRARERHVSTFVVFDTHWLSNFGYHINANPHHQGAFTSHEAPQMIQDLRYDLPGDTALAEAIAGEATGAGLNVIAHKVASLGLEYGTIVPMHYMNGDGWAKVVSVATPLFTSLEESRISRRSDASCHRALRRAGGDPRQRIAVASVVAEQKARADGVDFDRERVQPPGRSACAGALAAAPLPRIHRHASGLRRQMQRRGRHGQYHHAVRGARLGQF